MKLEIVLLYPEWAWMFRTHHSGWNSSTKHKNLRWKNIWKIQPLLLNHLCSINNQIFAPILGTFPLDPVCLLPKTLMLDIAWSMVWMASALATKKPIQHKRFSTPKKCPGTCFFSSHATCVASAQNCNCGKEIRTHSFLGNLFEIPWWTI